MKNKSKKSFEEYLNDLGIPCHDMKSNGGRIPDFSKYGSWLRRNDCIAFEIAFRE